MANDRFGKKWNYEKVVLALYMPTVTYLFNKATNNNPWILKIASIIGRTPRIADIKIW